MTNEVKFIKGDIVTKLYAGHKLNCVRRHGVDVGVYDNHPQLVTQPMNEAANIDPVVLRLWWCAFPFDGA